MKHTEGLLVRHPRPRSTESLLGYCLRLSEVNGFESSWALFGRAGMAQHEWKSRGIRPQKIAAIADCPPKYLERIAYYCSDSPRVCRLLDHPLVLTDLDLQHPRVCPECVCERGFIEAQWDLVPMIGCPLHSCWSVTECLGCKKALSWFRPGLLKCSCGFRIRNPGCEITDPAVRSLLAIIRAKVLDLLPFADFGAQLPIIDLHRLELRTLLRIIWILGVSDWRARKMLTDCQTPKEILCSAAHSLSEWPSNLFALLECLGARNIERSDKRMDIRERFAPLYSALFKRTIASRTEDLDFLRTAVLDFATNHWHVHRLDTRTLNCVRDRVSRKFLTRAELARVLRVDPRTVKQHADEFASGPNSTYLVDSGIEKPGPTSKEEFVNLRKAAAELELPVGILRMLKTAGDFEVTHRMGERAGFRTSNIDAFRSLLLSLGPLRSGGELVEGEILLGEFVKTPSYTLSEKVVIVRNLIRKNIGVAGIVGGTVKGVVVLRSEVLRCIREERKSVSGEYIVNASEAAEITECDPDTLRGLLQRGLVIGKKEAASWNVSESSARKFARDYIKLSSVAKAEGTSSQRLTKLCRRHNIALLLIDRKSGGAQPFLLETDLGKVRKFANG